VSAAEVLICFSPLRQRCKKNTDTHTPEPYFAARGTDTEKEDLLTQRANPKSALREISLTGFFSPRRLNQQPLSQRDCMALAAALCERQVPLFVECINFLAAAASGVEKN